ncbi:hypothetical protein [Gorillibacterium sp. CAU 1737]|uniref:hypothetical protein n=1 Tax=Gorillibacterium sp. CAU 1737 TaxID=3140362 RepID=UPI00326181FD
MPEQRSVPSGSNVIYQANPEVMKAVDSLQQQFAEVGQKHINKPVRVQTVRGEVYEGIITHVDKTHLYLNALPQNQSNRGFFPPAGPYPPFAPYPAYPGYPPYGSGSNVVLPLALFDLLVLTLLI